MRLTREIKVTVSSKDIVKFFVDTLYTKSRPSVTMGTNTTMYHVLGKLVGRSDVEAVRLANRWADGHDHPRVKVGEFRRWLPKVLSGVFAEYMGETREHDHE